MGATFPQALLAGVTGTVALRAFVALRNHVLDRPPPYAARNIAARLARSTLHHELSPAQARRWGETMRGIYGPMLGITWALAREAAPTGPLPPGLLLGLGVLGLELATFPLLRATEPLRTWSTAEHVWLAAQTFVFGIVTETTFTTLTR